MPKPMNPCTTPQDTTDKRYPPDLFLSEELSVKYLLSAFSLLLFSLSALAGQIADIVPIAKDDIEAMTKLRATPERHVLLYFGDHLN